VFHTKFLSKKLEDERKYEVRAWGVEPRSAARSILARILERKATVHRVPYPRQGIDVLDWFETTIGVCGQEVQAEPENGRKGQGKASKLAHIESVTYSMN
jgi:hypothetical protein